jgi:hypothetical protein
VKIDTRRYLSRPCGFVESPMWVERSRFGSSLPLSPAARPTAPASRSGYRCAILSAGQLSQRVVAEPRQDVRLDRVGRPLSCCGRCAACSFVSSSVELAQRLLAASTWRQLIWPLGVLLSFVWLTGAVA